MFRSNWILLPICRNTSKRFSLIMVALSDGISQSCCTLEFSNISMSPWSLLTYCESFLILSFCCSISASSHPRRSIGAELGTIFLPSNAKICDILSLCCEHSWRIAEHTPGSISPLMSRRDSIGEKLVSTDSLGTAKFIFVSPGSKFPLVAVPFTMLPLCLKPCINLTKRPPNIFIPAHQNSFDVSEYLIVVVEAKESHVTYSENKMNAIDSNGKLSFKISVKNVTKNDSCPASLTLSITVWDWSDICAFSDLWALSSYVQFLCPPLKKEGHIALHMSVGRYVGIP